MVGIPKRMDPPEGNLRDADDGFARDRYGARSSPYTRSYSDGTNAQTSWAMNFT
jgi:hypothetical protein